MYFLPYGYVHFVLWVLLINSLQHSVLAAISHNTQFSCHIHQCAKKKGISELKMVCAAAHKTGICN